MPAWRASHLGSPPPRAELIFSRAPAGITASLRPGGGNAPGRPRPHSRPPRRAGPAALLPGRASFPVRDLGSGEAGFLLRHRAVTTRVGTGPRKTSSWTGSTLVRNIGSELSAFP